MPVVGFSELGFALGLLRWVKEGAGWLRDLFTIRRPMKEFFGPSILADDGKATIIMDSFSLDRDRIRKAGESADDFELHQYPYVKTFPHGPAWSFTGSFSLTLGEGSFRALRYQLDCFTPLRKTALPVLMDERAWEKWEGTLICIGGPTANWHSFQILNREDNRWYNLGKRKDGQFGIYKKSENQEIVFQETDTRYGLVLRIPNTEYAGHWLFVCAGLSERGTSAASYYLAKHWRALLKEWGKQSFCIMIEADAKSDESARRVQFQDVYTCQLRARLEKYEAEEPRERGEPSERPIGPAFRTVTTTVTPEPSGGYADSVTKPHPDWFKPKQTDGEDT